MIETFCNTKVIKLGGSSQTKKGYDTLINALSKVKTIRIYGL